MPSSSLGPFIGLPPAELIGLDPGVAYKYVIPVNSTETSLSVAPLAGFTLAIADRTLTITYTGAALLADTTFIIDISGTKIIGGDVFTTHHYPKFKVAGAAVKQIDLSFKAAVVSGSNNLRYQTDSTHLSAALPINARLAVGTKIKVTELVSGTAGTGMALATVFFVVRVDDAIGQFQVSATDGGAPITPDQDGTFYYQIAIAVNTLPNIHVDDSTIYYLGEPITLTRTDGTALPSNFVGAKYVKAIIDARHITIATTVGGATLNANADAFLPDHNARLVSDTTGRRLFPAITTASEQTIAAGAAITNIVLAGDIAADSFAVLGLPAGLAFAVNTISGTPTNPVSSYRITLIAYKGSQASYRYYLLFVTGADDVTVTADLSALDPDATFDIATRRFYCFGPAGRADRIDHYLADPSLVFAFEQNGLPLDIPSGTEFRFGIKPKYSYSAPATLVYGTYTTIADSEPKITVGEDWSDPTFIALFIDKKYIDFTGQLELRFPTDPAGRYRKAIITVRIYNSILAGAGTPGLYVQNVPFTDLEGADPTDLQAFPTLDLAPDSRLAYVVRDIDGASSGSVWQIKEGDEETNIENGILRPADYNAATNKKVWLRVQGL